TIGGSSGKLHLMRLSIYPRLRGRMSNSSITLQIVGVSNFVSLARVSLDKLMSSKFQIQSSKFKVLGTTLNLELVLVKHRSTNRTHTDAGVGEWHRLRAAACARSRC